MTERHYTEQEVESIATRAVEIAWKRLTEKDAYTVAEVAERLHRSTRTIARMKLRRNEAGLIPHAVVEAAKAAK